LAQIGRQIGCGRGLGQGCDQLRGGCGLEVEQLLLNPQSSSLAVLTEDERELGVACVDIGAGTTDVAIFAGGAIRHTAVIPIAPVIPIAAVIPISALSALAIRGRRLGRGLTGSRLSRCRLRLTGGPGGAPAGSPACLAARGALMRRDRSDEVALAHSAGAGDAELGGHRLQFRKQHAGDAVAACRARG